MSIVGAVMVPHPPLIVPEVGRGGECVIRETTDSYVKACDDCLYNGRDDDDE